MDKKKKELSKEEQELLNLVTKSVSDKMGDTITDLVAKSMDASKDEEEGAEGEATKKEKPVDKKENTELSELTKAVNMLIGREVKKDKDAAAEVKKAAVEDSFNAAIKVAVAKTLEEVEKATKESGKKSKVNTEHGKDETGKSEKNEAYTISERAFKALPEDQQDDMVFDVFKDQMGINALAEIHAAARELNK